MAHFYGEIWGSAKTTGSRIGNKKSGLSASKKDTLHVYLTKGSHNSSDRHLIAVFDGNQKFTTPRRNSSTISKKLTFNFDNPNNQTDVCSDF